MNIKKIGFPLLLSSILFTGCSYQIFTDVPITTALVEKEIKVVEDKKLNTKWVVTNKYEIISNEDNNDATNSYFAQYRGMLDKDNKMKYIKLYISDNAYNNLGEINEVVGEDGRQFYFKLFKKECSKNDKNIGERIVPLEELNPKVNRDTFKIVGCDIKNIGDFTSEIKDALYVEHNKLLISLEIDKLKELSTMDYNLEFRYDKIKYNITIPKELSEGMYRQYFKYQ